MDNKQSHLRKSKEQYGEKFQDHYLEIYKMYVASADKISERRQTANSFFLSINTAIVGLAGYLQSNSAQRDFFKFYLLISITGTLICYVWYRLILSYKQINSSKFEVIHEIEQNLPISPYDAEWKILKQGEKPRKYLPFTQVEVFVPWVFFGLYTAIFLRVIWEFIVQFLR